MPHATPPLLPRHCSPVFAVASLHAAVHWSSIESGRRRPTAVVGLPWLVLLFCNGWLYPSPLSFGSDAPVAHPVVARHRSALSEHPLHLFAMGRLVEGHVWASRGTGCFFWRRSDWATKCLADCWLRLMGVGVELSRGR
eukprot:scaffold9154_cov152-Isochrysis_galbana.AAC.2